MYQIYWLFKPTKIFNIKAYKAWLSLNVTTEILNAVKTFDENQLLSIHEIKWPLYSRNSEKEERFKLQLAKELNGICEYKIELIDTTIEKRRKEHEEFLAIQRQAEEWYSKLDQEEQNFVALLASKFIPHA